jgi:hypothetical protein
MTCAPSAASQAEITELTNEINAYISAIQTYQAAYANWQQTVLVPWQNKNTYYQANLPIQQGLLAAGQTAQAGYIWGEDGTYTQCSSQIMPGGYPFDFCGYMPWNIRACTALGYQVTKYNSGGSLGTCDCDDCSVQNCCSSNYESARVSSSASWYRPQYDAWIAQYSPGTQPTCPLVPPTSANFTLGICSQCMDIGNINAQSANISNLQQQLNGCVSAAQSNLNSSSSTASAPTSTTITPATSSTTAVSTPTITPATSSTTAVSTPTITSSTTYMLYFLLFFIFIIIIGLVAYVYIDNDDDAPMVSTNT